MGAGELPGSLARGLMAKRAQAVAGVVAIGIACAGLLAVLEPKAPRADGAALVDTRTSLLATGAARDAATASDRAAALAAQIARLRGRRIVAETVGVAPEQLQVVVADLSLPAAPTPVARTVATARGARPYVLTVGLRDRGAPVVTLTGEAADPAAAERLVEGGIAALADLARHEPGTPPSVRIERLGEVRIEPARPAPGKATVAAFGLAAACAWLGALALAGAFGGRSRFGRERAERPVATAGRAA
ncbi:MAG TPA: hypothetical protein VIL04_09200 [Solirubrobacterales bacterium]|jgi:hypothetical protein